MQISQAKAILFQQQSEWSKVMGETEERQNYLNYAIILTVLSHVAMFIGNAFILSSFSAFGVHWGMSYYVVSEGLQLVLAVGSLYIIPQILAAIAPSFGGQNNSLNALKLYAFAMTPVWIGSMLGILPVVGWLGAIAGGIYGIILFWQHTAEAMSVPEDKKVMYFGACVVCVVVFMAVIGAIASGVAGSMFATSRIF